MFSDKLRTLKSLGAEAVFDNHHLDCGREFTNTNSAPFTTIATDDSTRICVEVIGSGGGGYHSLLRMQLPREDVRRMFTDTNTSFGEEFEYGTGRNKIPAILNEFEYATKCIDIVERLWCEGQLTNPPLQKEEGVLRGVLHGLQSLREGRVSAKKLVYLVSDTLIIVIISSL